MLVVTNRLEAPYNATLVAIPLWIRVFMLVNIVQRVAFTILGIRLLRVE